MRVFRLIFFLLLLPYFCVLRELYLYGANNHGQLGSNSTDNMNHWVPNEFNSLGVVNHKSGLEFSMFLTNTSNLYGVGSNSQGQFGNMSPGDYSSFVHVATNVKRFCVLMDALVLQKYGEEDKLYSTGNNDHCQLGSGSVGGSRSGFEEVVLPPEIDGYNIASLFCDSKAVYFTIDGNDTHFFYFGSSLLSPGSEPVPVPSSFSCDVTSLSCDPNICQVKKSGLSEDYYAWGEIPILLYNDNVTVEFINYDLSGWGLDFHDNILLLLDGMLEELAVYDHHVTYQNFQNLSVARSENGSFVAYGVLGEGSNTNISTETRFHDDDVLPLYSYSVSQRNTGSEAVTTGLVLSKAYTCFETVETVGDVCSERGECVDQNHCVCESTRVGVDCNDLACFYKDASDPQVVCGGHGTCYDPNICDCDPGYWGVECGVTFCYGYYSNHSEVCSSHGDCYINSKCECYEHEGYFGDQCNITFCEDGNLNNDTDVVCSGNGNCVSEYMSPCDCYNHSVYTGYWCNISVCFGKEEGIDEDVCSGHGSCFLPGNCSCDEYYDGIECEHFFCNNISKDNDSYVCNHGHGSCYDSETCNCTGGYNGTYCTEFYCWNVHYLDYDTCSAHGSCLDTNLCNCTEEDYAIDGSDCSVWICFDILNNVTSEVCSGHGDCIDVNNCSCYEGYVEEDCSLYQCGEYRYDDDDACSGRGVCAGVHFCTCDLQYYFNYTAAQESDENVVCLRCPNGTHREEIGGTFNDCELCPPGTYSTSDTDGCLDCPMGTYSHDLRHECVECPVGTYNPETGQSSVDDCLPCQPGYYGNDVGVESRFGCHPCPTGTKNIMSRQTSESDCVPCDVDEECPAGSSKGFPLIGNDLERKILYEDAGILGVNDREVSYLFKLIVMAVVFSLCVSLLSFLCCTSNLCFCCGSKNDGADDDVDKKNQKKRNCCSSLLFCCNFKNFDWCYDMAHDVDEGEAAIKRRTRTGGFFTIIAVSTAVMFLTWSISDFIYGSKKITNSASFFHVDENKQINGTMHFIVDFFGMFENCSSEATTESSTTLNVEGFGLMDSGREVFTCSEKRNEEGTVLGCECVYDCYDCVVMKSEMLVLMSFYHGGEYVRYVRYSLILPSFRGEHYNLTGMFYDDNGTCDTAAADISLYPRIYYTQSNWNLLLNLLDLERWGANTYEGIGAAILSERKNYVFHPGLETVPLRTPFSFNMQLSNFEETVSEVFPQTLLNFLAQIFALIGVSVSVWGIFFGRAESLEKSCGCFRCLCLRKKRGKTAVSPVEEEKKNVGREEFQRLKSYIKSMREQLSHHGIEISMDEEDQVYGSSDEFLKETPGEDGGEEDVVQEMGGKEKGEEEEEEEEEYSEEDEDDKNEKGEEEDGDGDDDDDDSDGGNRDTELSKCDDESESSEDSEDN